MSPLKTVPETVEAVIGLGARRARTPAGRLLLASVLAGLYISFGGALALRAGGGIPPEWGSAGRLVFAGVFPLGLLLVVFGGAALFTGDVMYVAGGILGGRVGAGEGLRALALSWLGNLAGALGLAWLIHRAGIYLEGGSAAAPAPLALYAVRLGAAKCSQGFWTLFVKGILCNQLVCLAVFMSLSARDGISKAALVWPPVFGFVALGMEHSVANMFFIPAGILAGADPGYLAAPGAAAPTYGWCDFLTRNLVPVTLGNVAGGALFVAAPYCLAFRDAPGTGAGAGPPAGCAGRAPGPGRRGGAGNA
ncbi:MAG: formate/nitrite transporter family protein [Deltaproteobacteria bacterium]|nr:formate/nitrite transporter family protein [Deltaproteobacteria bacterium]